MASGPNVHIARFVFENIWTVENLEDYVTGYYPDGVPLLTLRRALGYNRVPPHEYAHTLVRVAVALLALSHVRTPASVLLDLIIFRTITGLSQEEVCSGVSYVLFNHI